MLIKLTDADGRTKNETQWGVGVTHRALGDKSQELCSNGWIHYYEHPVVAVLMNPIHGDLGNPIGWECKPGRIIKRDGQLKAGSQKLTTIRRVDLPTLTTEQRVTIAIKCALSVYHSAKFSQWAEGWLAGADRSAEASKAAAWAAAWASEAAWAAARASKAASKAAAWAAEAAAEAAWAAARAAWAAEAAAEAAWAAARAAAEAAWAAAEAAWAAARAAWAVARATDFDLIAICEEVAS
jgi:hypothetical protein